MNEEMLVKAKAANSPEELLKLAHESGMEDFTEEDAKAYFETMHRSGELSDDELESAAGGCKTSEGKTIVTCDHTCHCGQWKEGFNKDYCKRSDNYGLRDIWYGHTIGSGAVPNKCGTCLNLGFKAGTGYCEID